MAPCDEELCQRRGVFFFQHRARIGLAGAQATALRMGGHTRPPAGVRQQPLQTFDAPVPLPSFADVGPFFAPSSRLLCFVSVSVGRLL